MCKTVVSLISPVSKDNNRFRIFQVAGHMNQGIPFLSLQTRFNKCINIDSVQDVV